jgi:hypothetical protein
VPTTVGIKPAVAFLPCGSVFRGNHREIGEIEEIEEKSFDPPKIDSLISLTSL